MAVPSRHLEHVPSIFLPLQTLSVPILMNKNYLDALIVAQGVSGIWFASGTVSALDATGPLMCFTNRGMERRLLRQHPLQPEAQIFAQAISLSGTLASPVGNIRISCKDIQSANGKIVFNSTGNSNDRHSIPYE